MKWTVPNPMDLIEALEQIAQGSSNNQKKSWLKSGRVLLNGFIVHKNSPLSKGDSIALLPKPKLKSAFKIYYADPHLIVVEKPEGLLSVDTDRQTHSLHTLLKQDHPLVWPVQRLDRETSGVMVFALSEETKEGLKEQFADHSVEREYYAIVEGILDVKEGSWKDHLIDGKDFVVRPSPSGVLAITHYKVVKETSDNRSHLLLRLKTGKKNQIRVQSSLAGHPVVGDRKYGAQNRKVKRVHLHAQRLAFIHPILKKKMEFFSPKPFR